MIWEINRLMGSGYKVCRDLGELLYHRENEGLSKEEMERLLELLTEERFDKIYNRGYDAGYSDGYHER